MMTYSFTHPVASARSTNFSPNTLSIIDQATLGVTEFDATKEECSLNVDQAIGGISGSFLGDRRGDAGAGLRSVAGTT